MNNFVDANSIVFIHSDNSELIFVASCFLLSIKLDNSHQLFSFLMSQNSGPFLVSSHGHPAFNPRLSSPSLKRTGNGSLPIGNSPNTSIGSRQCDQVIQWDL